MLNKQQRRAALRLTRRETRKLLWELRQTKNMSLEDIIGNNGEYAVAFLNQHGADVLEKELCKDYERVRKCYK